MKRDAERRHRGAIGFGGFTGALLLSTAGLLAQSAWLQQSPATHPAARDSAALCYDSARGRMLLFGGQTWESLMFGDTWEWDGTSWEEKTPAHAPVGRRAPGMVYDWVRGRAWLFGGESAYSHIGVYGDTWEWDGLDWTLHSVPIAPVARSRQGMAFDSVRGRVVMFGGRDWANNLTWADTWEWDGSQWTRRLPAHSPSPRFGFGMVYDSRRHRVVIYGGTASNMSTRYADTWEWDGTDWLLRNPAHNPDGRSHASMAYDEARGRVVLFGGFDSSGQRSNETWEWDGVDWTAISTAVTPPPRALASLAYDSARGLAVLFGGRTATSSLDDTWEYGAPTGTGSYVQFGAGCAGSAGVPLLSADGRVPRLGQCFGLVVDYLPADHAAVMWLGFSRSMANGLPLPLDLAGLGMPGCSLLVSGDATMALFVWNTSATWTLMIPDQPALLGLEFYNQAFAIDRTANALGMIATNAGAGVIGSQ